MFDDIKEPKLIKLIIGIVLIGLGIAGTSVLNVGVWYVILCAALIAAGAALAVWYVLERRRFERELAKAEEAVRIKQEELRLKMRERNIALKEAGRIQEKEQK